MNVAKAIEISDAKISFVSLVDKAANKRQFLITKADGNRAHFATLGKILKVDNDTHYVTGVVYEPLTEDTHGNFMTEEEIRKAAYWYAKNGDQVDVQHAFEAVEGVSVVETYIAPCDMTVGGEPVIKGTWLMTAEVENADVWDKVIKGEITGFSMGGVGMYSEKDVELADVVEKKGIFKRMAEMLGFDVVEKGEVADKFAESAKSSNFWNAWYALEETLRRYDWHTEKIFFETDEAKIREALADFSAIITTVLGGGNIIKSLAAQKPIAKAGKKISSKNYTELEKIYDSVGALLKTLSDDEEEEEDVTKQEVQAMIDQTLQKANTKPAEEIAPTAESIQAMIDEAVQKRTDAPVEPITAEMVAEMVNKAMEPILKARGLPSNMGGGQNVEKSGDSHYLAGII